MRVLRGYRYSSLRNEVPPLEGSVLSHYPPQPPPPQWYVYVSPSPLTLAPHPSPLTLTPYPPHPSLPSHSPPYLSPLATYLLPPPSPSVLIKLDKEGTPHAKVATPTATPTCTMFITLTVLCPCSMLDPRVSPRQDVGEGAYCWGKHRCPQQPRCVVCP